jgi:hypothetical protein
VISQIQQFPIRDCQVEIMQGERSRHIR